MSNHLMQRLNIAREDPNIRQALPPGSFRSQQQANMESRMMRAAVFGRMQQQQQQQQQQQLGGGGGAIPQAWSAGDMGGGGGGGAAAGAGGAAPRQAMVLPRGLSSAPRPVAAPPAPRAAAAAPELPHVFRRARRTVQISDPASGDLLQLDAGTWVLTDAAAQPATNALKIYTTDADSGAVMAYDIPMGSGSLSDYFDLHTFNPLDTAGAAS
jgi:hypothetical protein